MMNHAEKPKFPHDAARLVAFSVLSALRCHETCERFEIAGSLRRGKADVGDVEIVYIGKEETRPRRGDMFASDRVNLAHEAIDALVDRGVLRKRENLRGAFAYGEKNRLCVHAESGIPVDLFATTEASWWNYLVCRTGPAELNTEIATRAQAKGWKWTPYGKGFSHRHTGQVHRVSSEEDVFAFVGLPYIPPHQRR